MDDTQDRILLIVGRMEGTLDALVQRQSVLDEDLKELTARVAAVERWRAYVIGLAAGIGALTGSGVAAMANLISGVP